MPDLDGNQVLKKIRKWEKSRDISQSDIVKIVMISADDSKESIKASLKPGYETYIAKPINREKLAKAFRQVHYI
jgi:CheY-like chemotaxis protein